MEEQVTETRQKFGKRKISIIILIAVAVIGVGIALFFLFQLSDKQKYFSAERDTYLFLKEEVEERFSDELEWAKMSKEKPTESTFNISAEYQDPYAFGGVSEIEEIVNNSTITMNAQSDMEEKLMYADLQADIAGMTFEDIRFNLSESEFLLQLPFLDDVLQLESDDVGPLLHEMDPYTFEEDIDIDFSQLFDNEDYLISEDDREYLKEKYGKFVYEELPDEAFSTETEKIDVDGESVKADKITLHLTEEHIKTFATQFLEELESDERLEEIMETYFEKSYLSADEIDELMEAYDEGLTEMKDEVDNIVLPEGIESTVWTEDGLVVQRHFGFTTEDSYGEDGVLTIDGTHSFEDDAQNFDYVFNVSDSSADESVSFVADLSRNDEKIADKLTIGVDDLEIAYEADEGLKDAKHDFTRTFSIHSPELAGALVWSGDSEYEKDQMSSNHQLHVEADEINEDLLNIQLAVEGKQVKEIETIHSDSVKDIGKMSEMEIQQYIEGDASEQFYKWYMQNFDEVGF